MSYEIVMPKFGMTMKTAKVIKWTKEVGDRVEKDETILIAENEKFTNDVQSLYSGVLLEKIAKPGESYAIGELLGYIGEPGEQIAAPGKPVGAETAAPVSSGKSGVRIAISPLARKLAEEMGIDISKVRGSGSNGRIEKADILKYAEEQKAASAQASELAESAGPAQRAYEEIPYEGIRRAVGENMSRAWQTIPMVTHHVKADVTELMSLREKLNQDVEEKLKRYSVNDLLLKLTALALIDMPALNATFEEGKILRHKNVNLGMATALDNGLIVPVIRNADSKSLPEIRDEAKGLAERARKGKLSADDTYGGTFTVTNLGGYGSVDFFTPIINPPQAAILGVGRVCEEPVFVEGELKPRQMMSFSLTYDHRVLDGATAAEFMAGFIKLLENPLKALLR